MKSLITVNLKLRRPLTDESDDIGVITISQIGTVEVILDRDQMGKVFVAETTVVPDESFMVEVEGAKSTLEALHHQMAISEIACRRAQSSMFQLERYMTDAPANPSGKV